MLETRRELQRELRRMPAASRAADSKPAANVFPPPRMPAAARTASQPADAQAAPLPREAPTAARVQESRQEARQESRQETRQESRQEPRQDARQDTRQQSRHDARSAATRPRDSEQELQRELGRSLPPTAVMPVTEPLACAERLAKIARYTPLPSRAGPNGCGADDLVRVDSIVMPDRTTVALNPPPQIRCGMAEQFAQWVREDVGPAAVELGSPLLSISDNDAYDCRPRNGIKGAKLSEHGKGNALDITGIRLRNGGVFTLADQQVAKSFRDRVRVSACGRFMTVLGPGSDAYHGNHVHIDMAERARNYRICQWNVHETQVAAHVEPEPPQDAASAPPVAARPFVPPPPKAESKIEPKVGPKVEPKVEAKTEPKVEAKVEPQTEPEVEAKTELKPEPQPPAAAEPAKPSAEPPAQVATVPEAAEPAAPPRPAGAEPPLTTAAAPREPAAAGAPAEPSGQDSQRSKIAAAPEGREAAPEQTRDGTARPSASDVVPAELPPPPLPRRKPETLLTRAQAQTEARNRMERGPAASAPAEPSGRDSQNLKVATAPQGKEAAAEQTRGETARPSAPDQDAAALPLPPLPRRKPEALLTLAQAQTETPYRMEREAPRARSRYHSRHRFERDIRRFFWRFF